jgi:hypothetical protein
LNDPPGFGPAGFFMSADTAAAGGEALISMKREQTKDDGHGGREPPGDASCHHQRF